MKSNCCKSLTAVFLLILLMFSLWPSVLSLVRVLPSSSFFVSPSSSQKALLSSNSKRVKPVKSRQPVFAASHRVPPSTPNPAGTKPSMVAASLRRIPQSIPNPTQNKSKPKRML